MDTPIEEQQMFQNVTCNIAASEDEITEPNTLSEDFINCVSYKLLEYNMDYISLFYRFRIHEEVLMPCRWRSKYLG